MRGKPLAALVGVSLGSMIFGACNPPDTRVEGAKVATQSLSAVSTLFSNWGRNGAEFKKASEDAMLQFAKAPIALAAMLSKPIELPSRSSSGLGHAESAQTATPLPFPTCMDFVWTKGEPTPPLDDMGSPFDSKDPALDHGCEYSTTVSQGCASGDFIMKGRGTRSCARCSPTFSPADVACTYRWDVEVVFKSDKLTATLRTMTDPLPPPLVEAAPPPEGQAGGVTVTPGQLMSLDGARFEFELKTETATHKANLRVCSCGPLTFAPDCDSRRSPKEGTVMVQAIALPGGGPGSLPGGSIIPGTCARGRVTNCIWEVDNICECPGGATANCP